MYSTVVYMIIMATVVCVLCLCVYENGHQDRGSKGLTSLYSVPEIEHLKHGLYTSHSTCTIDKIDQKSKVYTQHN